MVEDMELNGMGMSLCFKIQFSFGYALIISCGLHFIELMFNIQLDETIMPSKKFKNTYSMIFQDEH